MALLSACAGRIPSLPSADTLEQFPPSVVVDGVPFHAQDAYQCGPAALAMMFNYRGIDVAPDALIDRVYLPERQGSLQVELVAAARERDLLVYPLPRSLEAILHELEAGNPVLVMQNLAFNWRPQWHYAVVIGYDLATEEMIVHSGLNRAQREPFKVFMRTWSRAEFWGRVMLPPDQLPATAEPLAYLRAVSDLEQTGRLESAKLAYTTALQKWPEQPAARFGLGNVAWAQQRPEESVEHFRRLVTEFPELTAGWNNLGVALEAVGCAESALAAKKCAGHVPPAHLPPQTDNSAVDCRIPAC